MILIKSRSFDTTQATSFQDVFAIPHRICTKKGFKYHIGTRTVREQFNRSTDPWLQVSSNWILFESHKPDLIEQRIKNFFQRRKVTEKRVGCGLRHVAEIMYALCVQLQPTSGFGTEFDRYSVPSQYSWLPYTLGRKSMVIKQILMKTMVRIPKMIVQKVLMDLKVVAWREIIMTMKMPKLTMAVTSKNLSVRHATKISPNWQPPTRFFISPFQKPTLTCVFVTCQPQRPHRLKGPALGR